MPRNTKENSKKTSKKSSKNKKNSVLENKFDFSEEMIIGLKQAPKRKSEVRSQKRREAEGE